MNKKNLSLLTKSSLPVSKTQQLTQQSSKLTDASHTTLGSKIASFAGTVTKSLGNIGEGPFDVSLLPLLFYSFSFFLFIYSFILTQLLLYSFFFFSSSTSSNISHLLFTYYHFLFILLFI